MEESDGQTAFAARCRRLATDARKAGVALQKAPAGRQALEVSRDGRTAEFPIVSDEGDWHATTVAEAFYAVLLDTRGTARAQLLDDAAAEALDDAGRALLPAIEREVLAGRARSAQLAELLGGQTHLDALCEHLDDPAA